MKKEQLKLRKEIKKVRYIAVVGKGLTKNKVYEVYGIYLRTFSDRSTGLSYLIKCDDGVLRDCPLSWFEIVEENSKKEHPQK